MRMPYKDLSLSQLRTFCDVCRTGSYARSARQLHLSTSAVWEQMRGLERQFASTLFEARDGAVRPTSEGRQLLEMVQPLLAGLGSINAVLHQRRGRPPEMLTLVSGMRMLIEEVSQAAALFRQHYPEVRLRLLFAEDCEIEALVERGDADLGLILEPGPGRAPRTTVVHEAAYTLDFVAITPPGHPLLKRRGPPLRDLTHHPLVIGAPGTSSRRRIDEIVHQHDLHDKITIAAETNSTTLTYAYVRAGIGIGIAAGNVRGHLGDGLGVRSLAKWFGAARYVFVWARGAFIPPAQRELADLIRSSLTDRPRAGRGGPRPP
jgi:DNA-binding transcriptional LysR family regulator